MATEIRNYHYDVIRAPIITEKSSIMNAENQYVFEVAMDAGKPAIKEAIEALYKVEVTKVRTIVRKGKTKRFRGRPGRQNDMKKAIVTLKDAIEFDVTQTV